MLASVQKTLRKPEKTPIFEKSADRRKSTAWICRFFKNWCVLGVLQHYLHACKHSTNC